MFDTIHKYTSLFRCNFCLELLPVSGSPSVLDKQRVYLVTENPHKYLKRSDMDEALHMEWIACCGDWYCTGVMNLYAFPVNRTVDWFTPRKDAPTFDALSRLMTQWEVATTLKSEIMIAAHFVGDRPAL